MTWLLRLFRKMLAFSRAATFFLLFILLGFLVFYFYALGQKPFAPDDILTWIVRKKEEYGLERQTFLLIVGSVFVAFLGCVTLLNSQLGRSEKTEKLFRFFITAMIMVILLLFYRVYLYDYFGSLLSKPGLRSDGLKELFALKVTLFAFLAGFVLLNTLQEFSESKKNAAGEIQRWTNIHALLKFFMNSEGADSAAIAETSGMTKNEKKVAEILQQTQSTNHTTAKSAMDLIETLGVSGRTKGYEFKILSEVYDHILKLKVADDNDRPALFHLVEQYTKLQLLLTQRYQAANKEESPNGLLLIVLGVVAFIVLFFASDAAFLAAGPDAGPCLSEAGCNVFDRDVSVRAGLAIGLFVLVLPMVIILTTINDLRDHYSGMWAINFDTLYKGMRESFAATRSASERPSQQG